MICVKNINKRYLNKTVINNFSIDLKKGEMVAVTGASGSGKTTLLNIIGLLESADSGELTINNIRNPKINSKEGRKLLKNDIGFIFQNFALIDEYTVLENFKSVDTRKGNNVSKYIKALEMVGLKDTINQKVFTLSGGEQQRVAIAKIIYKDVKVILADEPTGSLDEENRNDIIEILIELKNMGKTIIIVTHDKEVSKKCDYEVSL